MHPLGNALRRRRRQRIILRHPIDDALWSKVIVDHPILRGLTSLEDRALREFAIVFLHEKRFEPPADYSLNDYTCLSIAVQACLPVLHLGFDWIGGWTSVIIHPDEFVQRRVDVDEAGVTHEWDDPITGEAHPFGPILLSVADVEASGWGDGYNVVIHEIAHKLDMRAGGVANGCPPLHAEMTLERWQSAFAPAYENFRLRPRRRKSRIDSYAAENPSEFFAVTSEYFFERPATLAREFPAVYEQLRQFYRQDPLTRDRSESGPRRAEP